MKDKAYGAAKGARRKHRVTRSFLDKAINRMLDQPSSSLKIQRHVYLEQIEVLVDLLCDAQSLQANAKEDIGGCRDELHGFYELAGMAPKWTKDEQWEYGCIFNDLKFAQGRYQIMSRWVSELRGAILLIKAQKASLKKK